MKHKTWDIYIEFDGQPMYAEFFDDLGDMDEDEVVDHVMSNLIVEATAQED
jgi:hypothetical protein